MKHDGRARAYLPGRYMNDAGVSKTFLVEGGIGLTGGMTAEADSHVPDGCR